MVLLAVQVERRYYQDESYTEEQVDCEVEQ